MQIALLLLAGLAIGATAQEEQDEERFDLVVYGGTSSGVMAAVQAARMGRSVALIEPGQHLGGMSSAGLGATDIGDRRVIGGLARAFYEQVKERYGDDAAWKFQPRDQCYAWRTADEAMWRFEPHVAEAIFDALAAQDAITVMRGERLPHGGGVEKQGARIVALTLESGARVPGRMFIDASYEGDLMAWAGVDHTLGRESNGTYEEKLNGLQRARATHHQLSSGIDPYVVPGDPESGLLPGVHEVPFEGEGAADERLQAYCFRMCLTTVPENRVPFTKPEAYDVGMYELLLRNFEAGETRAPWNCVEMPNAKTDTNNNYGVSTDAIGLNYRLGKWSWPELDYEERAKVVERHERWQRGLLWTLVSNPRVPQAVREQVGRYGLAKDEFVANGNWPHAIYVREARRMRGEYVMTEHDCMREQVAEDPVGMGAYNMDSHHVQRYVDERGHVRNEGDVQVKPAGPYAISYRALLPKAEECENLLVPVCLSASHTAFGSIRMEPVFMILGQSAATAACLALDRDCALQELEYEPLRARLLADGQVLE